MASNNKRPGAAPATRDQISPESVRRLQIFAELSAASTATRPQSDWKEAGDFSVAARRRQDMEQPCDSVRASSTTQIRGAAGLLCVGSKAGGAAVGVRQSAPSLSSALRQQGEGRGRTLAAAINTAAANSRDVVRGMKLENARRSLQLPTNPARQQPPPRPAQQPATGNVGAKRAGMHAGLLDSRPPDTTGGSLATAHVVPERDSAGPAAARGGLIDWPRVSFDSLLHDDAPARSARPTAAERETQEHYLKQRWKKKQFEWQQLQAQQSYCHHLAPPVATASWII